MPRFRYKAKDESGREICGDIEAMDARAAAAEIRGRGLWLLEITDLKESAPSRAASLFPAPSLQSQAVFFRQLEAMLSAGISVGDSMATLGKQRSLGRLSMFASDAAKRLMAGDRLSNLMESRRDLFRPLFIGLIRAGEEGGSIDLMVGRTADYIEREIELRRQFSRATLYPKLVVLFIIAVVIFLPHIPDIINGRVSVKDVLIRNALHYIAAAAVIWITVKLLLLVSSFRYCWDWFKMAVPVLGQAVRKMALARFASSLSVMYSAGMPISQAAELSADAVGSELLAQRIKQGAQSLRAGGKISDVLKLVGGVPELVVGMAAVGERAGNLDAAMAKVAEYYESEARTTLEKTGVALFVALILAAGAAVAFIVIRFWSQFYQGIAGGA